MNNSGGTSKDLALQIIVLSDLHAFSSEKLMPVPSHLPSFRDDLSATQHPIKGFEKLAASFENVDMLLCPGDITFQADRGGLDYAWKSLHSLAKGLNTLLYVVSGNHDVDSRGKTNSYDPLEHLKNITPPFPTPDPTSNDTYWARHFTFVEDQKYRLLLLNSCAYHNGENEEREKGRISVATINKIAEELAKRPPKPFNILLCHHHPQAHSDIEEDEYNVMKNGFRLLERLAQFGNWIVVHGHKHHPKISYAAGGSTSPIVFAAASFSAALYVELQSRTRNQFYCLNVTIDDETCQLRGEILAWNWAHGRGWVRPEGSEAGLAARSGFGCRLHPQELAAKISDSFSGEFILWTDLVQNLPMLEYLIPQDYILLKSFLSSGYGLRVVEDSSGPYQVGKQS